MGEYILNLHHSKNEVNKNDEKNTNAQAANDMARMMNYRLHAEQLYIPLLNNFEVLKPNNPMTIMLARHQAFVCQLVSDGPLGEQSFEERVELIKQNTIKHMANQKMKEPEKNYFYYKDFDNGIFKFTIYVQDIIFKDNEEEKIIRQFNAFFLEPKFNDVYQLSMSAGPFTMPTEFIKCEKVELETDKISEICLNMLTIIMQNLKYRE